MSGNKTKTHAPVAAEPDNESAPPSQPPPAPAPATGVVEISIRLLSGAKFPIRIKFPEDGKLTWRDLMNRDFMAEGKTGDDDSAYMRGGKGICHNQLVSSAGFIDGEAIMCIMGFGVGLRPPPTLIAGIEYRYVPNVVLALCAAIGDGFAPELAAIINDYLPYQQRSGGTARVVPKPSPMCSSSRYPSRNLEEKCGACNRYRYERVEIEPVRIDDPPNAATATAPASVGIRGLQIIVSLNSMIGYSNKKLVSYDFDSVNKSDSIQIPLAVVHHKATSAAPTSLALPTHDSVNDFDTANSAATNRAGQFLRLITDQLKARANTERRIVGAFTAAAPPVPDDDDVDDYSRNGTVTPGGDLIWTLNAAQSGGGCGVGCYTVVVDEASLPWIGKAPHTLGPIAWQFTVGMPPQTS